MAYGETWPSGEKRRCNLSCDLAIFMAKTFCNKPSRATLHS